jgi:hypothetical protein
MKAEGLRLGNYVYYDVVNEVGDDSLEFGELTYHALGILLHGLDQSKEKINPIEINEYWLEKFGFIQPDPHYLIWFKEGFGPFRILFDVYFKHWQIGYNGGRVFKRVKYVHDLQNLYFDLTGQELTIK